jgi:hypothetical protein
MEFTFDKKNAWITFPNVILGRFELWREWMVTDKK